MTVDAVALEISNNAILTSNIIVRNSTTFVERVMTFRGRDYNGITKSVDESSSVNRTHLLNRFHQTIFNIHCKPPIYLSRVHILPARNVPRSYPAVAICTVIIVIIFAKKEGT